MFKYTVSLLAVVVLSFTACLSPYNQAYIGRSYPPTTHVDIYLSEDEIKEDYQVMGHLPPVQVPSMDMRLVQKRIVLTGHAQGADGVVIHVEEREIGTRETTYGSGQTQTKETTTTQTEGSTKTITIKNVNYVRTIFIKYKKNLFKTSIENMGLRGGGKDLGQSTPIPRNEPAPPKRVREPLNRQRDRRVSTPTPRNEPTPPKEMVLIPAGKFQMGSIAPAADSDEKPVHTVSIDAFYIDKYQVTNAQYKQFVLANPRWQKNRIDSAFHNGNYLKEWNGNNYPSGKANHPVVSVSWYAAMAYAQWAGKRLPTEAEWEYAARGGLSGKKYPWGDVIDLRKANYGRRNVDDTTPVDKYPPNGYGLYNMAGNVWEWCLDEYNPNFYASSPRQNPLAGASSVGWITRNFTSVKTNRVLRGGSWGTESGSVRVTYRNQLNPASTYLDSGFRCVRSQ